MFKTQAIPSHQSAILFAKELKLPVHPCFKSKERQSPRDDASLVFNTPQKQRNFSKVSPKKNLLKQVTPSRIVIQALDLNNGSPGRHRGRDHSGDSDDSSNCKDTGRSSSRVNLARPDQLLPEH